VSGFPRQNLMSGDTEGVPRYPWSPSPGHVSLRSTLPRPPAAGAGSGRRSRRAVPAGEIAVTHQNVMPKDRRWTASELRKLPPAARNAILEAAAALAEGDYRHDPRLTAFEAFGEDDLSGDSSSIEPR
jgi:hypothetical protein